LQICDWSDFDAELSDLAARIERGEAASNPGFVLTLSDSAALQRKAATNWIRKNYPPRADLPAIRTRGAFEKLKIGYFSADYRNHPVAQLTAGLFETHDRSKFEVIGFSFGPDTQDEMRKRMERAFDRFLDLRTRSAPEVASLARDMQLDIAVDLGGFTEGSSLEVFARRAAPLQVEFLGYPGTVGAPYIDYLIADRTVIPESAQVFYTEQIAYLPNCFQPNEAQRQVSPRTPSRADCGLPDRGFVFCCFNNHFKITPAVFAVWMRLLRDVGGSVLWLADGSESMKHNLRRSAATSGVAGDRLLFAPRMPDFADHLARLRVADLFLDTLPYNAHTTASNALGAGLPLLTCQGTSLAARVASSLLTVLELPELIATNLAQYEAMARRLAARPELLRDLRERLARNQRSAPLFDTERYCRGLEAAYLRMWRRRLRGELPASFAVEEPSPG
jgi:predicted O-linked N-acetylglucosamine transferase (SPINDLY family)